MPIRNRSTTDNFSDTEATFVPASTVTFQINNYPARVQMDVVTPSVQRGGNWIDKGTVQPGIWTLGPSDFSTYGGNACVGLRFMSDISGFPAVVNVNN